MLQKCLLSLSPLSHFHFLFAYSVAIINVPFCNVIVLRVKFCLEMFFHSFIHSHTLFKYYWHPQTFDLRKSERKDTGRIQFYTWFNVEQKKRICFYHISNYEQFTCYFHYIDFCFFVSSFLEGRWKTEWFLLNFLCYSEDVIIKFIDLIDFSWFC